MHIGRRYRLTQTLAWSQRAFLLPMSWSIVVTSCYAIAGVHALALPWLPMSAIAIAVAFYLGFKNNASYDRLWEARKVYGAIVNASRAWAYGARDLITDRDTQEVPTDDVAAARARMVHRHVAWMDALRHQLRRVAPWEHSGPAYDRIRRATGVPELTEDLRALLLPNLPEPEVDEALAQINPAARLIANQSRDLAYLRRRGLIDGFAHLHLQQVLQDLISEQGKAERIKNFPFPRQYATVNSFFAAIFAFLLPFGMLGEFATTEGSLVWLTVPFSTVVSWVFLTADQIGDWSENPFEGLANDVPISTMSRAIERDVRQILDETTLPPSRQPSGMLQF